MIQKGTILKVCDNSGINKVKCIKILGNSNPRYATIGNLVLVAISNKDIIRGFSNVNIKYGLIVNIKKFYKRLNGEYISFDNNCCVIIDKNKVFSSTRIYNPVTYEFKNLNISNLMLYVEAIL